MTFRQPVYIGGSDVSVYVCGMGRWAAWEPGKCEGAVKHPHKNRCWYCDSEGVCKKLEMENEVYQKQLTGGRTNHG